MRSAFVKVALEEMGLIEREPNEEFANSRVYALTGSLKDSHSSIDKQQLDYSMRK